MGILADTSWLKEVSSKLRPRKVAWDCSSLWRVFPLSPARIIRQSLSCFIVLIVKIRASTIIFLHVTSGAIYYYTWHNSQWDWPWSQVFSIFYANASFSWNSSGKGAPWKLALYRRPIWRELGAMFTGCPDNSFVRVNITPWPGSQPDKNFSSHSLNIHSEEMPSMLSTYSPIAC